MSVSEPKMKRIDYIFLILIVISTFIFGISISGLMDHEEIPHYLIFKSIDINFANILSPYGKPAFTVVGYIFYVIFSPSIGYTSIRLAASFLSSISIIFTYKMAKLMLKSRSIGAWAVLIMFGSNLYLLYSGACLSEVAAMTFFTIAYYYHLKERFNLSAVFFGISFLARFEMIFIISILGLIHFRKRRLIPICIYASVPLLWMFLIFISGNDVMEVITYNNFNDTTASVVFEVSLFQAISNYFTVIFSLVGYPISILFLMGTYFSIKDKKNGEIYLLIFAYIGFQILLLTVNIFGSGGRVRYFYVLIPVISIISAQAVKEIQIFVESLYWKIYSKKREKQESSIHNTEKIRNNRYRIAANLLIIMLLAGNAYYFSYTKVPFDYTPKQIVENETGQFLSSTYDLRTKKVLCPLLGVTFLLTYFYEPKVYFLTEEERHAGDDLELRYNYTFFDFDGFIGNQQFKANILDVVENDSLVVWDKINYSNSILNPANLTDTRFTNKLENEYLIVYEVIF